MTKRFLLIAGLAASAACYSVETPNQPGASPDGLGSFQVDVTAVRDGAGKQLPVVQSCSARYGGDALVPAEVRGTPDCRYGIASGQVSFDIGIRALTGANQPLDSFSGPVSFRVVPGDLSGDYSTRWTQLTDGAGSGKVIVSHLYGEARVWVEDLPPTVNYVDGGVADAGPLPVEPAQRTSSTGLSRIIYFEEPTLANVQRPESADNNRNSPFAGQFLTIGRAPESGSPLLQNCPNLPPLPGGRPYSFQDPTATSNIDGGVPDPNHGQMMTLVVTGIDPSGFFVADLTACKAREQWGSSTKGTAEPEGLLPGSYASLYVYNYSYPEDLYAGDLLWTLSGSATDFTGTTQLSFPAWTVREHVRELPQSQWNKYLDQAKPTELTMRTCGLGSQADGVDPLCGYDYGNQKMESLESGLVRMRNVLFPSIIKSCDFNGDNTVPFFCPKSGGWGACGDNETPNEAAERKCNADCTIGIGEFAGKVCSEKTSFTGYGQFVVEMAGPGAAGAGLDESVTSRVLKLNLNNPTATTSRTYVIGSTVRLWCDTATRVKFGPVGTVAGASDTPLPSRTLMEHVMVGNQSVVGFYRDGPKDPTGNGECFVSVNTRTRINVITRDAVPELALECSEDDADAEKARQCRNLHGAKFDVVGHLKQVTAARPRWTVTPRDLDDVCCHPGQGLECPKPIKQCQTNP
ncbi:hypothetical protein P2318_22545 [Myxococcaceae bacterium GXIMD 01537]